MLTKKRQLEFWLPIDIQNLSADISEIISDCIGCNLITVKLEYSNLFLTFQEITTPSEKRNIFVSQSKKVKDGVIIDREMFIEKSVQQFSSEKKSVKVLNVLDLGSKWLGIFEHVLASSQQQKKRG